MGYGVVGCMCQLKELGDGGFSSKGEIKDGGDGEIGRGEMVDEGVDEGCLMHFRFCFCFDFDFLYF